MNFMNSMNFGIAIRPLAWVALLFLHLSWAGAAHAQSPAVTTSLPRWKYWAARLLMKR